MWPGRLPPSAEELHAGAAEAEGLLTMLTDRVDESLLAACPRLRAIANYAVGVDNIDLAATGRREIMVGNTPDVLTEATADLTFTLLLAAARRLPEALLDAAGGDWVTWEPGRWLGADVAGATLGIVGMGRIGRAVARRAHGFAMEVLHTRGAGRAEPPTDPALGRAVSLDTLLTRADFVSLHCPLTEMTRHLIDADALVRMRSTAILVNTARGPIVDQAALVSALRRGTIAGAALDVTDPEPPSPEDPLFDAPNLIVAPHIGSATWGARTRMAELAIENLRTALAGRPMPHAVSA